MKEINNKNKIIDVCIESEAIRKTVKRFGTPFSIMTFE